MKDKWIRHGTVSKSSLEQHFCKSTTIISEVLHLVQQGLMILHDTKTWLARDIISYSGRLFSCVLYNIMNFKIIALEK